MKQFSFFIFLFFASLILLSQEVPDSLSTIAPKDSSILAELPTDSSSVTIPDSTDGKKKKREKKIKEPKPPKEPRVPLPPDTIPRPTLGVHIGMLSYNGDIKSNENVNIPFSGGPGFGLSLSQELSPSFDVNLNLMMGVLSANERSLERNLNFRSSLFTAGFNISYNFNHFLNERRTLSPYIAIGLETIEFTSKSDLIDQYGNEYHYWSDGTIRNISETSPFADQSVLLQRDYVYETDIRSQDYDGVGNYNERSFGIPVSLGADLRLTSKIDFGFNWTYHFAFTDDIDGVSSKSSGDRIGSRLPNSRNDHFWFLSAGLNYNFTRSATGEMEIMDQWSAEDLMAFGTDDYDGDGIYDFMDECPQTDFGVEVDERGCPLNPEKPITLSDSEIYVRYLAYIDSTGLYTKIEKRAFSSTDKKRLQFKRGKRSFKVKLGEFVGGVPQEVSNALLGLPDVETHVSGDTTIFTVGDYDNLPEAIQRKIKVAIEGFEDAEIVMQNENGKIVGLGDEGGNIDVTGANYDPNYLTPFVFRVQLGAFKKKKPSEAFKKVSNLVVVENESGYTKYMSGAFDTYVEASKHKIEMMAEGWDGAFVVAYKRGQGRRLSMEEAGVTEETVKEAKAVIAGDKTLEEVRKNIGLTEPVKPKEPEFDKSRIKFKIQIGIYKNQVPPDVLSEYMKLNNLAQIEVDNSSAAKRYTSGEFDTYQSAVDYRNKLIAKGFETAFIIALKDNELISIDEARKLIGEIE
ncbi:MAG: hypothetical protein RIE58_08575 [Vicingaceae bacterium]